MFKFIIGGKMASVSGELPFIMEELKKKTEMTFREAAFYLGIAEQTLRNYGPRGRMPRHRLDHRGRVVFLRADLDAYKRDNMKVREAYA